MEKEMKQLLLLVVLVLVPATNVYSQQECTNIRKLPQTIKDVNAPSIECIGRFHDLMSMANHYGKIIGFPETMQAILLQETQGGRVRTDKRQEQYEWASFGVMQIQPETAKYILECLLHKENVPDVPTLKMMLKTNDSFTIHLSTVYFKYLYDKYLDRGNHSGTAWRMALLAYNIGPGKLTEQGITYDPNKYLDGIRAQIKLVKVYNTTYHL